MLDLALNNTALTTPEPVSAEDFEALRRTSVEFGVLAQILLENAANESLHKWVIFASGGNHSCNLAGLWSALFMRVECYARWGHRPLPDVEPYSVSTLSTGSTFLQALNRWYANSTELCSVPSVGYSPPALQWLLYECGLKYGVADAELGEDARNVLAEKYMLRDAEEQHPKRKALLQSAIALMYRAQCGEVPARVATYYDNDSVGAVK